MTEISVIVPTYKREIDLLNRSIVSLLNQTASFDLYDVIIVDDNEINSQFRKNNIELIDKYNKEHPEFQIKLILNKKNLGGALSRNEGVNNSESKFVTFLDDDDEYLKVKLLKQLNYIRKYDYDLVFSNLIIKNESRLIDFRSYDWLEELDNDYLLKSHLLYHITGTPTFMFKRESFLKIGGFPEVSMGQEFHLMLASIQSDLNIGYLNSADVIAYIHKGERISNGNNKINGEKNLYKLKLRYQYLFSKSELKYIKMRHHAVLAFAYLRSNKLFKLQMEILRSLKVSPLHFTKELFSMAIKKKKLKKLNL